MRRCSDQLQAANCERDGNIQDAYLFLYRHAEFCMTKIATHPDRKQPQFKPAISQITKDVKNDLAKLEELKPSIRKRYERYQDSLKRIEQNREKEKRQHGTTGQSASPRTSIDATGSYEDFAPQLLNAGEHSDLALRLAHRELRRRGIAAPRQVDDMNDLTNSIAALGRQLDGHHSETKPTQTHHDTFAYPSVPTHSQGDGVAALRAPLLPPKTVYTSGTSPLRPPKEDLGQQAPPLPSKGQSSLPLKDELASSDYTFKPLAFSEAGAPLRPVFLPQELRSQFLSVAQANTTKNLETCGILCGTLISGALFISHLVIPDQVSTSDTCDTTEEGDNALFDYVDGEQLMVCGWIHTHPSQTCFLSSRDLHTSVGYQVMLPESIAIVCAPSKSPDHGIFRLTDPPGKQAILNCHQPGIFHPHAQTNLYTDASRPGHVNELKGLQFQLVDLRKKG